MFAHALPFDRRYPQRSGRPSPTRHTRCVLRAVSVPLTCSPTSSRACSCPSTATTSNSWAAPLTSDIQFPAHLQHYAIEWRLIKWPIIDQSMSIRLYQTMTLVCLDHELELIPRAVANLWKLEGKTVSGRQAWKTFFWKSQNAFCKI